MPDSFFLQMNNNHAGGTPPAGVSLGHLRVHFGILPGAGQIAGLKAALKKTIADPQCFVIIMAGAKADQWRMFSAENVQIMDEKDPLWDKRVVRHILNASPTLVVVPELSDPTLSPQEHDQFIANLMVLLKSGVHVTTSLPLLAIERMGDLVSPAASWPHHAIIDMVFLRQYVEEYIVHDTLPQQLLEQYYQGLLALPPWLEKDQASIMQLLSLSRLREFMLNQVASHAADVARKTLPETAPPQSIFTVDVFSQKFIDETCWAITINAILLLAVHIVWYYFGLSFAGAGMLLLAGPLITAITVNQLTSTGIAILQFLGFNYFFMEPYFEFFFESTRDMLTLLAFMLTTLSVGWLANKNHHLAIRTRYESLYTKALLRFLYDISYRDKLADIIQAALHNLNKTLGYEARIILAEDVDDEISWEMWPEGSSHSDAEYQALASAMRNRQVIQPNASQPWLWCPLNFRQEVLGVLGIRFDMPQQGKANISLPLMLFIRSYADLLATSFRQRQLRLASRNATEQADRESLRAALLSSVSHDLKTPLVSIIGSLSTLENMESSLPEAERAELFSSAREEAERLHHIIHNVLEITKLESGQLLPRRESVELSELLGDVVARCRKYYPELQVKITGKRALPVLDIDPILMGQVFYNLLDNAAKYAGTDKPVEIQASTDRDICTIVLRDFGPGLPKEQEDRIFDKFHRYEHADRKVAGSGLGLAICRGIAGAHGGTITAVNAADKKGGTMFIITLPFQTNEEKPHE